LGKFEKDQAAEIDPPAADLFERFLTGFFFKFSDQRALAGHDRGNARQSLHDPGIKVAAQDRQKLVADPVPEEFQGVIAFVCPVREFLRAAKFEDLPFRESEERTNNPDFPQGLELTYPLQAPEARPLNHPHQHCLGLIVHRMRQRDHMELFRSRSPEKKIITHLTRRFFDRGLCSFGFPFHVPRSPEKRGLEFPGQGFDGSLVFSGGAGPKLMVVMDQAKFPEILGSKNSQEMKKRDRIRPARAGNKDLLAHFKKLSVPEMIFETGGKTTEDLFHIASRQHRNICFKDDFPFVVLKYRSRRFASARLQKAS
jgi:hypothetical protein